MDKRLKHVERFIALFGGNAAEAARAVGVTRAALCSWRHGRNGVSPDVALRIELETAGEVTRDQLLWEDRA